VGDVARSIILGLQVKDPAERTFNIGTGVGVTLHDFKRILGGLYPDSSIEISSGLEFRMTEKKSYCIFDISKAKEHLGFTPAYDLEAGIKDYIATIERLRPQ